MSEVKKQVYSCWAFLENEREKAEMNKKIYEELKSQYKIAFSTTKWNPKTHAREYINQDDYDIVVDCVRTGYGHTEYRVLKNKPELSRDQLALICDGGNLCFGYRGSGNQIIIHTD